MARIGFVVKKAADLRGRGRPSRPPCGRAWIVVETIRMMFVGPSSGGCGGRRLLGRGVGENGRLV